MTPSLLDDAGLMAAIVAVEDSARALHQQRLALLSEAMQRGLDSRTGDKSLAQWYCHAARIDPAQVRRWMRQAELFLPSRTPTGSVLEPLHPVPLDELSEGHLDALAWAADKLPDWAGPTLAEYARSVEPSNVRKLARQIKDQLDQDEPPVHEERDELHLRDLAGGRLKYWGEMDPEAAAQFKAMLEPLAKPSTADDSRPLAQRQGDAFAELLGLAIRAADLPTEAGERPHVSMILDQAGRAMLDTGIHLSEPQFRLMACNARITPILLGEELRLGRTTRACSLALRRVLHARDRGCAFPGCDRPPKWCDAHHVKYWSEGGLTDVDNMVLLCKRHHRTIHHSEWEIEMVNGIPLFYPPRSVDPQRRPRQNALHRRAG
jgi:hypothetical protein